MSVGQTGANKSFNTTFETCFPCSNSSVIEGKSKRMQWRHLHHKQNRRNFPVDTSSRLCSCAPECLDSWLLCTQHVSVEGGRTNCHHLKFCVCLGGLRARANVCERVCVWPWRIANPPKEKELTWKPWGQRAWLTICVWVLVYAMYVPAMLCMAERVNMFVLYVF